MVFDGDAILADGTVIPTIRFLCRGRNGDLHDSVPVSVRIKGGSGGNLFSIVVACPNYISVPEPRCEVSPLYIDSVEKDISCPYNCDVPSTFELFDFDILPYAVGRRPF